MSIHSPLFADKSNNDPFLDEHTYRNSGHLLIGLKATEGLGFRDGNHHDLVHRCHAVGISVIHYHFGRPDSSGGAAEAAFFLEFAGAYLGPHDYVSYDGERAANGGFGLSVSHCRDFDRHIQAHSRFHSILYASASQLGGAATALVGDPKRDWDANYSSAPNTHAPGHEVIARQFTDGHVGPGPHSLPGTGSCDVNVMLGSLLRDVFKNADKPKRAS